MSVSVRTRFELFKRDRFTCSYCGRTPPEVLLEADHIIPKAAGGGDGMENLTTACATCNRGKAARLLEEGTAPVVGRATVAELAERVEQAKAYMELLGGLQSVTDEQVRMVFDAWAKAFRATNEERADGHYWTFPGARGEVWPAEPSLRRVLRSLTLSDVLLAVDIAAAKMSGYVSGGSAVRYFFGVCHRAIKQGGSVGARPEPMRDDDADGRAFDLGARQEHDRLRSLFLNLEEHGYASAGDLVAALWPDES